MREYLGEGLLPGLLLFEYSSFPGYFVRFTNIHPEEITECIPSHFKVLFTSVTTYLHGGITLVLKGSSVYSE